MFIVSFFLTLIHFERPADNYSMRLTAYTVLVSVSVIKVKDTRGRTIYSVAAKQVKGQRAPGQGAKLFVDIFVASVKYGFCDLAIKKAEYIPVFLKAKT